MGCFHRNAKILPSSKSGQEPQVGSQRDRSRPPRRETRAWIPRESEAKRNVYECSRVNSSAEIQRNTPFVSASQDEAASQRDHRRMVRQPRRQTTTHVLAERRSGKWAVRCADPQASNSSDEGVRSSFRKNGRHRVVPDSSSLNRLEVGAARPRLCRVRYRVGELASHQQHGDQAVSEERLFGSTDPPVLCQGAGNKVPLSFRRESK